MPKDQVSQKDNLKAMFVMGHGGNTVTRMPEAAKGIEKLDLLVVADPVPTTWAALSERKDNTYLLPIATSYETSGSRTSSNRSIQWGEQIVKPIFESKDDLEVMYLLAKKLGFAEQMFKNIKVENNVPVAEDLLREINRGGWSTGYCGQSPERLKAHMKNQDKFDLVSLRAPANLPDIGGDYYGLPWPCWGTPEAAAALASFDLLAARSRPLRHGRADFEAAENSCAILRRNSRRPTHCISRAPRASAPRWPPSTPGSRRRRVCREWTWWDWASHAGLLTSKTSCTSAGAG